MIKYFNNLVNWIKVNNYIKIIYNLITIKIKVIKTWKLIKFNNKNKFKINRVWISRISKINKIIKIY